MVGGCQDIRDSGLSAARAAGSGGADRQGMAVAGKARCLRAPLGSDRLRGRGRDWRSACIRHRVEPQHGARGDAVSGDVADDPQGRDRADPGGVARLRHPAEDRDCFLDLVLPDRGIDRSRPQNKAMLDLLLAINKIPADKVKIQVTGAATRNTVFVNGQVDSFISVLIGSPLDLVVRAQQGKAKPVYFMPFADFRIAPMGQGLLAHERVIAENPEMLRRFVRASANALNEIVKPDKTEEAVDVAMRLSGARDARRESVKLQWLETTRRLATKNTEGHPLGWMSDKDWAVSVDILVKTGQLEKPIPTQSLYTNEFVPTK